MVGEGEDQLVWRATPAGLGEVNAPPSRQSLLRSGPGIAKRWNGGARRQRAARTRHVEVQSDRQGREPRAGGKLAPPARGSLREN